MSKWYSGQGNNSDVVLASKIRLARNLDKVPFPCKMSNEIRKSVCRKIFAALQNSELGGEFDLIGYGQVYKIPFRYSKNSAC